jgi:hypothetical protein
MCEQSILVQYLCRKSVSNVVVADNDLRMCLICMDYVWRTVLVALFSIIGRTIQTKFITFYLFIFYFYHRKKVMFIFLLLELNIMLKIVAIFYIIQRSAKF